MRKWNVFYLNFKNCVILFYFYIFSEKEHFSYVFSSYFIDQYTRTKDVEFAHLSPGVAAITISSQLHFRSLTVFLCSSGASLSRDNISRIFLRNCVQNADLRFISVVIDVCKLQRGVFMYLRKENIDRESTNRRRKYSS